ncbi:MAG TPA: hypothetical protein VFG43_04750 [Geminicoccaceae bacterium]|nr:hypothetical protein [Geminicoccaceae bacterium]
MKKDEKRAGLDRRDLLRGAGLVAGGAAGAVVAPLTAAADEPAETRDEMVRSRYRETEEVKRFYALNRL